MSLYVQWIWRFLRLLVEESLVRDFMGVFEKRQNAVQLPGLPPYEVRIADYTFVSSQSWSPQLFQQILNLYLRDDPLPFELYVALRERLDLVIARRNDALNMLLLNTFNPGQLLLVLQTIYETMKSLHPRIYLELTGNRLD